MAKSPEIYTRLPGLGIRGTQAVRLWLGPDHLLFVSSSLIGERYKRFYFADIQAITVHKTVSLLVKAIVLLVIAALFAWAALESVERAPQLVFGIISLAFVVFVAIHASLGATCRCVIRTAVQTEELITLKRVRHANRVLDIIRPLILATQQRPQPAETAAHL